MEGGRWPNGIHPGDAAEVRAASAADPQAVGTLEVDYPRLAADPASEIARIVAFLGPAHLPNAANMTAAIHPALHRRRGQGGWQEPR